MLDRQIVPPISYFPVNLASEARFLNRYSSPWISSRLSEFTFLMWGTTRPLGESMAMLMLWLGLMLYSKGFYEGL